MPIFEFRCQDCGKLFEKLFINPEEEIKLECPNCQSENFIRVISKANHAMGGEGKGKDESKKPNVQTKDCGSGNQCGTIELPGQGD